MQTMTTSHHLAEASAQTLTDHDLAAFADQLHADYINHNRYAQPDKEGSVGIFAGFLSAFEDFRVEIEDVIDAGHYIEDLDRLTSSGRLSTRLTLRTLIYGAMVLVDHRPMQVGANAAQRAAGTLLAKTGRLLGYTVHS